MEADTAAGGSTLSTSCALACGQENGTVKARCRCCPQLYLVLPGTGSKHAPNVAGSMQRFNPHTGKSKAGGEKERERECKIPLYNLDSEINHFPQSHSRANTPVCEQAVCPVKAMPFGFMEVIAFSNASNTWYMAAITKRSRTFGITVNYLRLHWTQSELLLDSVDIRVIAKRGGGTLHGTCNCRRTSCSASH